MIKKDQDIRQRFERQKDLQFAVNTFNNSVNKKSDTKKPIKDTFKNVLTKKTAKENKAFSRWRKKYL